MDMTKALKRHRQVGERAGGGRRAEGTKGGGLPSQSRDREGGGQEWEERRGRPRSGGLKRGHIWAGSKER